MQPENSNWEIEHLIKRFDFEQLNIAYEQAEKIYEQEKFAGSTINSFSVWERLEYQISYLQNILDANQLQKFVDQGKRIDQRF